MGASTDKLSIPNAPSSGMIVFYSRYPEPSAGSWFGHVWVQIAGVGTYGFYPEGIKDDSATPSTLKYQSFRDRVQLNRGVDVLRSYAARDYNLVLQNCIDCCRETASAVGLKAPPANWNTSPAEWLGNLTTANL